ncbi:MAG: hypothetical protein OEQ13_01430 [Acidobacteriota bacterium]|nr:hypothetical protein [Acidobacteriota bacterium]
MARSRHRRGSGRPHLVLRLRKGWTYDPGRRRFTKEGREPVRPGTDLPKYTRITFQVPAMAQRRKRSLAEDELARGIQIVPPRGVSPGRLLPRVRSWPCVEKAWVAPAPVPASLSRSR